MIVTVVFVTLAIVAVLAVVTAIGALIIERRHPAKGRLITVEGQRLHTVELGSRGVGPPVVLLHGASGNLEDMRLALGETLARHRHVILIDRPGHGWSERRPGDTSPARQAALVASVLDQLGIGQAVIVGHSWSGALASAFALDFPEHTAGLVLISPVTHPWPGGIAWYYRISAAPFIGPLFVYTLALPLGLMMIGGASSGAFLPQAAPRHYVRDAAIALVLRPRQFAANARDVAALKAFVAAQVERYGDLVTPTVIITGDCDNTVSPDLHSRAIAAMLPNARLVVLEGFGHMPHHAGAETVIKAIDELATAATNDLAVVVTLASEAAQ
jgi:pimeloyl-ACP methyl ester carboxylesterase